MQHQQFTSTSKSSLLQDPSPWFICPPNKPASTLPPTLRLFCFPFAGGGALAFRTWRRELPPTVELVCIQPPGRENRIKEAPIAHIPDLVQQLKPAILNHLTIPFAFFGHSMGALIAFELARSLHRTRHPLPQHLFVSACAAPHLPRHDPPRHTLSKSDFMAELRNLNGTPSVVLNNAELMEALFPLLKADFSVADGYDYQEYPPLPLPITALGGNADPDVSPEQLMLWHTQTTSGFDSHIFPGDHFFIQQARSPIIKLILKTLLISKE